MSDIKYSTHVLYIQISMKPLNTIESKKCGKAKFNARISKFTDKISRAFIFEQHFVYIF